MGNSLHWSRKEFNFASTVLARRELGESHKNETLCKHSVHKGLSGCGGQIWTDDLQVMSLTSYRAAPPREFL